MAAKPTKSDLEKQYMSSTSTPETDSKSKKLIAVAKPSSSILLISPLNQILLLHRIQTSSSFPSAHVFPGGNLDAYHESPIPNPYSPEGHRDSEVYRLGAIRECFEESGILLARKREQDSEELINISPEEREIARKRIHSKSCTFAHYLDSIDAVADTGNLYPFTRWITPSNLPKRFTTQMYIYFMPLPQDTNSTQVEEKGDNTQVNKVVVPRDDGGIEHTAAEFAYCETWLEKARRNGIILFPPQFYLMELISALLAAPKPGEQFSGEVLSGQREKVREFLKGSTDVGGWGERVMSPIGLGMRRSDGRVVLGLDRQGPELDGEGRKGDEESVVLVKFGKEGPRDVEVRFRREVLGEERRKGGGENGGGDGAAGGAKL